MVEFDLLQLNSRSAEGLELLGLLSKEGWLKARIDEYQTYREALNRFTLGVLVLSEPIVSAIRRELRRVTPGLKVEVEEIEDVLRNEVIKREVLDCDKAVAAQRQVTRAFNRAQREKNEREAEESSEKPIATALPMPATPGAV